MEEETKQVKSEGKKELTIEELKQKLEESEKLKDEYLAGWQRERADFLNYKKEEMERIGEFFKYANLNLILKILPILDNFEIAEKKLPENLKADVNIKGLLQIKTQLQDFFKNQGVEEIKSVGEKFDPNFHEVVEEVEAKPAFVEPSASDKSTADKSAGKDKESGIIIEEVQKGYKLNGRVIRPARVKVNK